jgi:hypothetical protein
LFLLARLYSSPESSPFIRKERGKTIIISKRRELPSFDSKEGLGEN